MKRIVSLTILSALPLVTGCASSILPTSYLVHANVPYSDVLPEGGVNVFWTDRTVSMSPYKNILVEGFAVDKVVGVRPGVNPAEFAARARHLVAAGLNRRGKNTVTDASALAGKGPYLAVRGNIAQLNPGKYPLRKWIGFGAGRGIVDMEVKVFRVDAGRRVLCAEITSTRMASSLPLVADDDITVLNNCLAQLAENVSAFIAGHRNRPPKKPEPES